MDEITYVRFNAERDFGRVRDLFDRAGDYVRLETGKEPGDEYVRECLSGAPPQIGPDGYHNYGLERPDGTLAGFAGSIQGYYAPKDWYMGLLVLDPAERGKGLGTAAFAFIRERAEALGAPVIRIAVLDANKAGRRFWERQGFTLERTVPGDPEGDGHMRHVRRLELDGGAP
ncbi:GNAT family N-acetyltransferase [Pontivivens ytuae]|uniref:GNAT family N-acetyltransferase n=1 Tax=Pontivivens ytuae TaxID=2789856 RepID=A0A7S9LNH8_9RHOB|nr:GNAT family N-acetyltransferase [Pontivivens ytuae]QPH52349.1 GNAT family N-acetyltransferase [Pontivivens ytuae]